MIEERMEKDDYGLPTGEGLSKKFSNIEPYHLGDESQSR